MLKKQLIISLIYLTAGLNLSAMEFPEKIVTLIGPNNQEILVPEESIARIEQIQNILALNTSVEAATKRIEITNTPSATFNELVTFIIESYKNKELPHDQLIDQLTQKMVISDLLAFITVADQLEFIPALIFAASQFLKTKSLCNNVIQKINSGQLGLAVRDGISGYLLNGEEIKMNEAPENWKFSLQDCLNYRPQTLRFDKETRKKMISTEIKISDLAGLENIPNKEMIIELYLDANKIATIPAGNFMGFNNLRTLVLEHNKITRITAQNFEGLSNLQGLYLSHNQIKHIEPQAFAGLPNLQEVVLDHNEITQIPIQAFALPNKLRSLYLNYNLISQIPAQAFVKLNALQELHLCGNQISCVQGWALKGLTNLQKLHLSLNPIKEISIQAFKNLNNLQEAYFFRTKLSQKQENELRNALPNLRIDF